MFRQDQMKEELLDNNDDLTEKQKEVLAAATVLFAEKGFAATSTSEIAKKAGVAEGTIFRHYKTKKELLLSIVGPIMARFIAPFIIDDFKKVLDQHYEYYEDFLKAVIENRRQFLEDNMSILRILLQEIPFHPELREKFKEHVGSKVMERLRQIVRHYQLKGQIKMLPEDTVIRLTASSLIGYLVTKYIIVPENKSDNEKEIERTIQFIMSGL